MKVHTRDRREAREIRHPTPDEALDALVALTSQVHSMLLELGTPPDLTPERVQGLISETCEQLHTRLKRATELRMEGDIGQAAGILCVEARRLCMAVDQARLARHRVEDPEGFPVRASSLPTEGGSIIHEPGRSRG